MNIIDDDGYGQYVDLSTNFNTNIVNKYHNQYNNSYSPTNSYSPKNRNNTVPITRNKDGTDNACNSVMKTYVIVKPTILIELSKYFRILSRPEVIQLCLSPIIIIIALYMLYFVYSSVE